MIGVKKAMQILKKKYPERTITQAIDYDSKWLLFLAVEDLNKIDYDSPYYAVGKFTGEVRSYNPVDDLEKFTDALYNRQIEF